MYLFTIKANPQFSNLPHEEHMNLLETALRREPPIPMDTDYLPVTPVRDFAHREQTTSGRPEEQRKKIAHDIITDQLDNLCHSVMCGADPYSKQVTYPQTPGVGDKGLGDEYRYRTKENVTQFLKNDFLQSLKLANPGMSPEKRVSEIISKLCYSQN